MPFGCQARSFGEGIYADDALFLDVVRQAGEVGFEGLETNWKNLERYFEDPGAFAGILESAGLRLIGAHMGTNPWVAAPEPLLPDLARTARFVRAVGGECIVFSGAPAPAEPDAWKRAAGYINTVGEACASGGVCCLYHNHWWECEGYGLERLHELTDPGIVSFAFDTGHALRAGKDPAAVIETLGPRLGMLHLADFRADWDSQVKRPPLGEGVLDFPAVVAALRSVGFEGWVVLEEETRVGEARAQVERGLALFRKAFGEGAWSDE